MGIPISLVPMYMSGQMTERAAKSTRFPIMCFRNSPSFFSSICQFRGANQWVRKSWLGEGMTFSHQCVGVVCDTCLTPGYFSVINLSMSLSNTMLTWLCSRIQML